MYQARLRLQECYKLDKTFIKLCTMRDAPCQKKQNNNKKKRIKIKIPGQSQGSKLSKG